ncbi:hypothetical protein FOA52_000197 [Chlamydomonas sp. UWO 241]|nr:hypothetical protein FOA52_000197 [Chlamydomonas sp. UWO 241]
MGRPILSSPAPVLTSVERSRLDTRPETELYSPVMVHHTDDVFRRRLRDLYRQVLPPGARVLDLCSSFASHLPPADDLCLGPVTGLGLNEAEMTANKRLDAFVTHDLNAQPRLPFGDGSFDAVLWCCGIQYLQYPEVISAEASRVLSPGGSVLVSFSTHCYAEKAIAGWLERDDAARLMLVTDFLRGAGFGGVHAWGRLPRAQARSAFASGGGRDAGAGAGADAFYAVAATRPAAATVSAPSPSSAGAGARGGGGAREQERDPASLAARYVAPALREIELLGGEEAGPGTDEAATAVASGTGGSDSGGVVARGDGPSGLLQQPVPSAAWREGSGGDAVDAGVRPETLERISSDTAA